MERLSGSKAAQAANEGLQPGDLVTAEYKTGMYIGELVEFGAGKAKVRVMAVIRHPEQGNLHVGHRADNAMFHQRRALAYWEIANMPNASIRRYSGEVPPYAASLKEALARAIAELEEQGNGAGQSMESLRELEDEYARQYGE